MSYCVNCGVELDASAKGCALCNTPVVNPKELVKWKSVTPFPEEKEHVEMANRKDFGILLSTVCLATAITCGLLNAFVFSGNLWSLAVIGVCVIVWVMMIPVVIYSKISAYAALLFDGISVGIYLYMLTFLVGNDEWFLGLGLPIVGWITLLAEVLALLIQVLPRSFLTIGLYIITDIALLCTGLELLIERYLQEQFALSWSAVVMTVCVIVDIAIITLLSRRRLRNEVRRRLHF